MLVRVRLLPGAVRAPSRSAKSNTDDSTLTVTRSSPLAVTPATALSREPPATATEVASRVPPVAERVMVMSKGAPSVTFTTTPWPRCSSSA